MYYLHLGVSNLLKECDLKRLRDPKLSTYVPPFNAVTTIFPFVKRKIRAKLYWFLAIEENELLGYGLKATFSKSETSDKLVGIHQDHESQE